MILPSPLSAATWLHMKVRTCRSNLCSSCGCGTGGGSGTGGGTGVSGGGSSGSGSCGEHSDGTGADYCHKRNLNCLEILEGCRVPPRAKQDVVCLLQCVRQYIR